jgi:peptidoglycan-N-acetylglucosamine deacetylase
MIFSNWRTRSIAILVALACQMSSTLALSQQSSAADLPGARLGAHSATQQATPGTEQPGTGWTVEQLQQAVAMTRVGKKLTPKTWPNGARVAVCLNFDIDTESYLLAAGEISPTTLSAADYGAEAGLNRFLNVLEKYQVPATFFIPAVSAILHPEMVPAILRSGRNEIGVHGWIHENPPSLAAGEEDRLMKQAIDYLTKVTGKRPVGYRAPSWSFSLDTMGLLQKYGFLYDSSLSATEEPYEITSNGKNTGVVELPIDWTLTDSPYLGRNGHLPSPAELFQLYKDEFDGAYDEGTLFILTLHPDWSGHRALCAMRTNWLHILNRNRGSGSRQTVTLHGI